MISGRLLSKENIYMFVDEYGKTSAVSDYWLSVSKNFTFWAYDEVRITTISIYLQNSRYTAVCLLSFVPIICDLCTLCLFQLQKQ